MYRRSIISKIFEYKVLFSNSQYLLLTLSTFFYATGFYFFTWYLPVFIMQKYGALYLSIIYILGTAIGLLAVISGVISDVLGYKYLVIGVPALVALSYMTLFFKQNILTALLVAIVLHITPLGGPPISALISIISKKETLGMAFSLYRLAMMIGFTISSALMAIVTQVFSLSLTLLLGASFIAICILLRVIVLRHIGLPASIRQRTAGVSKALSIHVVEMFRMLGLCGILAFVSMSTINALALSYGPFLYNFIKEVLGLSIALLGIYQSLVTIMTAISQPISGIVIDYMGKKAFNYAIYAEVFLSVLVSMTGLLRVKQGTLVLTGIALALILLYELTGSILSNAIQVNISSLSAKEFRGSSYGLLTSLSSLIAIPIYPIFAYVWCINPVLIPLSYGLLMLVPLIITYFNKDKCY